MKQRSQVRVNFGQYSSYLVLFLASLIVILLVSKNSPLFYLNDWVDLNAFLTMGNGWTKGLIPYKELFEQKGPILYLIFGLASKISSSYFGVYLLEVFNLTIISSLIFKIGNMFFEKTKSYLFVFLSYSVLFMTPYFMSGGSAEEFGWLSIVYAIYLIFLLQKNDFKIPNKHYFFAGIMLSYLFWIKYTMIGIWLGFFLALICILLLKKEFKQVLYVVTYSLLGFFCVTTPILIYFQLHGAVDKLYFAYFYSNMKLYPSNLGMSFPAKAFNSLILFVGHMYRNFYLFILFIIGFFSLVFSRKILKNNEVLFLYSSSYVVLVLTVLFGGKDWNYYYLIIFPFACIPFLLLINYIKDISKFQLFLSMVICGVTMVGLNQNIKESKLYPNNPSLSTENRNFEPAQKIFASIIKKEKNPTLLNYGSLDVGLYHAAGVLPVNYYFMRQNIPNEMLPEMMREQNRLVDNKSVDFIVTMDPKDVGDKFVPDNIKRNYKLVAEHSQDFEGNRTYRLYKKK